MKFSRGVMTRVFLRSFAIQGSWNYRSLIGSGFAYALLPALRSIYRNDQDALNDAVRRHSDLFNSHPYFSPLALGAVAVLEAEESADLVTRFKSAVRGSLGALGDRLVWSGWRPVCALLALALIALGAPWWTAVAAYLVIYNVGHIGLRLYVFRLGLVHGKRVGEELRKAQWQQAPHYLDIVGAVLVGLMLPLTVARPVFPGWGGALWTVALIVAAVLGLIFGGRVRTPVALLLAGATVVALAVSVL
jgi:mannose/fructose/N-acetylgalactosamine-specific phosphotransferase system component IID